MNIVFTMAGKYSRFKLFGAQVPKYLLPIGQGTILSKIIGEINNSYEGIKFYFVANRNDQLFYPIIKSILKQYDIDQEHLIYIDDTNSQLETATYAEQIIDKEYISEPICFANIDTVAMNRRKFFEHLKQVASDAAVLDTFEGRSAKYSYVRTDKNHSVLEVSDKNIISEFACSGLYGFGSFSKMLSLAGEALRKDNSANFTSLYNLYIEKDKSVSHVPSQNVNDTVVLGTPEEYVINIHRFAR